MLKDNLLFKKFTVVFLNADLLEPFVVSKILASLSCFPEFEQQRKSLIKFRLQSQSSLK